MTLLILPALLFLMVAPVPGAPDSVLADFSRFSKVVNTRIAIVDQDGTVHEGVVTEANLDAVKVRADSGLKSFSRASVASAERLRDGRIDGVLKGALFGLVIFGIASQGCDSTTRCHTGALIATTAGIGYVLDAMESHRPPLYRAQAQREAGKLNPTLSLSFRF
jgi:hypothetical protein